MDKNTRISLYFIGSLSIVSGIYGYLDSQKLLDGLSGFVIGAAIILIANYRKYGNEKK